jgi:hypothetical protein
MSHSITNTFWAHEGHDQLAKIASKRRTFTVNHGVCLLHKGNEAIITNATHFLSDRQNCAYRMMEVILGSN